MDESCLVTLGRYTSRPLYLWINFLWVFFGCLFWVVLAYLFLFYQRTSSIPSLPVSARDLWCKLEASDIKRMFRDIKRMFRDTKRMSRDIKRMFWDIKRMFHAALFQFQNQRNFFSSTGLNNEHCFHFLRPFRFSTVVSNIIVSCVIVNGKNRPTYHFNKKKKVGFIILNYYLLLSTAL